MYIFTFIASTATSVPAHRQHVNEVAAARSSVFCEFIINCQELMLCISVSIIPPSLSLKVYIIQYSQIPNISL